MVSKKRSFLGVLCAFCLLLLSCAFSFKAFPLRILSSGSTTTTTRSRTSSREGSFLLHANGEDDFDGAEFNEALKAAGPVGSGAFSKVDKEVLDGMRAEQVSVP